MKTKTIKIKIKTKKVKRKDGDKIINKCDRCCFEIGDPESDYDMFFICLFDLPNLDPNEKEWRKLKTYPYQKARTKDYCPFNEYDQIIFEVEK